MIDSQTLLRCTVFCEPKRTKKKSFLNFFFFFFVKMHKKTAFGVTFAKIEINTLEFIRQIILRLVLLHSILNLYVIMYSQV